MGKATEKEYHIENLKNMEIGVVIQISKENFQTEKDGTEKEQNMIFINLIYYYSKGSIQKGKEVEKEKSMKIMMMQYSKENI